jgi:CO/xanthine dehydrogenase Mo-binding subunit
MANLKLVGNRVPRHDAWAKVKGEQAYSDDFAMPGMIYGKVLRSKYPAAILKSIDTSKALALPGVHCVLTAKDLVENTDVTKFGQMRDVGGGFEGLYKVLADGKVRYKSEAIALIAADTEELCEEACNLIEVEYEVTEGVYDAREALKPGAYLVSSEDDSNLIMRSHIGKGDIKKGFEEADYIIENDYFVHQHDHVYLETEGGVCWVDQDGVITMRVGTQVLEHYRTIAKLMHLPHNKVRNMGVAMGGGFGGKEEITVETYLCLLAQATRKPVKMVWDRSESLEAHCKRHPEHMHYKTGFTKDGKIVAQQADIEMDAGGYTFLTPWVQMYSTIGAAGCYNIPNVEINVASAMTNNMISSANRGFGQPQVNVAYESQIDEAADALGIDKREIRKINCLKNGDEVSTGFIPEGHIALIDMIDRVWDDLENTCGPKKEYTEEGKKVGRGMAIGFMSYGRLTFMHDSSRVAVRIELDGSVTVRAGVPDLGGGQGSVLCQIVAEELGLPIEKMHVFIMDTHLTPLCGTTTATRQLYMSGNAALTAVKPLRERLINKASKLLGYAPQYIDLGNEKAYVINQPDIWVPIVDVIGHVSNDGEELFNEGQFNAPFTEVPDLTNMRGRILPDFTYSAHAVEIAVDEELGKIDLNHIVACYDVGRAVNRNSCEGQIEGGAVYNMWYICEDLKQEKGIIRANKISTYLIPTAVDAPEVELDLIESAGGLGPYGAKGVGEPADNSITPAILNALKDATGVRFTKFPITPEVVLDGIKAKKEAEKVKVVPNPEKDHAAKFILDSCQCMPKAPVADKYKNQ